MVGNIGVELYLTMGEISRVSPILNQPIFNNNTAYSELSPNIITTNICGYMVSISN